MNMIEMLMKLTLKIKIYNKNYKENDLILDDFD